MLEAQDAAARVQFAEEIAQEASAATTICEMKEDGTFAVISLIHVTLDRLKEQVECMIHQEMIPERVDDLEELDLDTQIQDLDT